MAKCPECKYPLPSNLEQVGARCPSCHDPLYEPPGRKGQPVRPGESACAVHSENLALGPCQGCGQPICEVCRCSWEGKVICAACAGRRLEGGQDPNDPLRGATRMAGRSLLLALLAWALGAGGVWLGWNLGQATGPYAFFLLFITFGTLLGALGLAVSAVGEGAAALLVRGSHETLALPGILLGGILLGGFLGLLALGAWLSG